jgi:hypothetical protein
MSLFQNYDCVLKMLHPSKLHQAFVILAKLPTDAFETVASLYEALLYVADKVAPDVSWKFQQLVSGLLLPNQMARVFHTYAVKLIISNFRRLVLQSKYPD